VTNLISRLFFDSDCDFAGPASIITPSAKSTDSRSRKPKPTADHCWELGATVGNSIR